MTWPAAAARAADIDQQLAPAAKLLLLSGAGGRHGSKDSRYRRDRQTDGRTPDRYIDMAPHRVVHGLG